MTLHAARADEAADRLRHVATLARAGSLDEAVAAMPGLSALDRGYLPQLQDVSQALRAQRPAAAAHVLAAMGRLDPGSVRSRAALESIWADNPFLDGILAEDLPQYPVIAETTTVPGLSITTLVIKPFVNTPLAVEPASGAPYPGVVNVYVDKGGRLVLRFIVHAGEKVEVARARQVGRFLAALSDLTDTFLGAVSRVSYPMPVWLSASGEGGARQWNGAILVQAVNAPRSDIEWARELAHEWGHASLPGVDGFTAPEAWANGDLGERLFLPMLAKAGRLDAWGRGLDAEAYARQTVAPLRTAFAQSGPSAKMVTDTGRKGYDHFLGACLYIHDAYGPALLLEALDGAGGGNTRDFLAAFQTALAARPRLDVTHLGAPGPRPICLPSTGRYSLNGKAVRWNGRPLADPAVLKAGWTMLQWEGVLSFRRAEPPGKPSSRSR